MFVSNSNLVAEPGMAFKTVSDSTPYLVLGVTDETVYYAPDNGPVSLQYAAELARQWKLISQVSVEQFPAIVAEVIESHFAKAERLAEEKWRREDERELLNSEHTKALLMNVLVDASRGEDLAALMEKLATFVEEEKALSYEQGAYE